ncbi:regulatory protein RecX [Herbivorax sp. ANBcel31]|uniref:regulatory protein RecX n=1 Tax=Herbivorax sp. ANBcel31 TaxID=3069754 RepID=UPI0027B5C246|nr:regulatory protein RecX [Herbivorax sp. ANBcel31]MDQ2086780.1 regulatory protein RecX [Herbivorax sp. ANBcel31]
MIILKITSIEKNKKNKKMFSVFIDNSYAFSISEEDYFRLNLYEKSSISEEEIDDIKKYIALKSVKSSAIKCISFKMLSEKELFHKLALKGYDEDVINIAIDELKSMGYLNDMMYAQKFVYDRMKLKPKSKKVLSMELKNRGISRDIIENVLDNLDYDEDVVIERLLRKKFGKYDLTDSKILKKAYSFLLHRGFNFENIKYVIDKMTKEKDC